MRGQHNALFTTVNLIQRTFFPDTFVALKCTLCLLQKNDRIRKNDGDEEVDIENIRKELQCTVHPLNTLGNYKYVVVCTWYKGRWILSRHRKRDTWETQGGHIEAGETPMNAAQRELREESGIEKAMLYPVCDYYGYNHLSHANGMVFLAVAEELGDMPESEMRETRRFDVLPPNLTYPDTTPVLIREAENYLWEQVLGFRKPQISDIEEIEAFKTEFLREGSSMDGTGRLAMCSAGEWLTQVQAQEHPADAGIPCFQYGLFERKTGLLLGLIQIRLELKGYLIRFGGHIGYCVRPAERRKGYAGMMLRQALAICRERGLKKILITCLESNIASAKTIESCGGIYEETVFDDMNYKENMKRYWISLEE